MKSVHLSHLLVLPLFLAASPVLPQTDVPQEVQTEIDRLRSEASSDVDIVDAVLNLGVLGESAEPAIPLLIDLLGTGDDNHMVEVDRSKLDLFLRPRMGFNTGSGFSVIDAEAEAAADTLVKIGQAAIQPLVDALGHENPETVSMAAYALIMMNDSSALDPVLAVLGDDSFSVRWAVASQLGYSRDPRTRGILVDLLNSKDAKVRLSAVKGLRVDEEQALEPMMVAVRDLDADVRYEAALALRDIEDVRAVDPLIAALEDEDSRVRALVCQALGRIHDPRAIEPLIAALKDENRYVRAQACEALGGFHDPRAIDPLIAALKDEDGRVRGCACEALGGTSDARAIEPLIAALEDEDIYVREQAESALEKMTGANWGRNPPKWRKWWKKNRAKFERGAPAASGS